MRVRELSQNILHRIARLSLIRVRWTFVIPATVIVGSIVIVGLVWGSEVSALSAEAIGNTLLRVIARFLFFMTTMIISLTVFFLKFFILLAGYNGFSTAPAVELGWTLIRDIANMIFIIALLVIAFATILGREDYALKKTLGKLLLMAIFINFSKLIAQLIIDAAHVVTMTFLNALSAVAGGNLIQMFKFREIMSMNTTDSDSSDFLLKLVGAGIMGVSMTFMAFCILGAYFIIMLYRMVALWILIILSPIAYAAAALPSTASVAQNWWKEFTDNVIAAPIMVFFMWLAFASMANSASLHHVAERNSLTETTGVTEFVSSEASSIAGSTEGTQQPPVSLSDGTTWENMASFAIAIGFLFVGIERVQKLGVKGAGALNKAKDIGIKGGMVLSGLAATRWAAKKGWERTKQTGYMLGSGMDTGLRKVPLAGSAYRFFADNNARWEGAVEKTKQANEEKRNRAKLLGSTSMLAASDKTLADATIAKETMERKVRKGQELVKGERLKAIVGKESDAFEARYQKELERETIKSGAPLEEKEQEALRASLLKGNKFKTLQSLSTEAQAKRATGKAQGGIDRNLAKFRDMDRVLQGGQKKYFRAQQEQERREDMEDYARFDYDDRADAITKTGAEIRKLANKQASGGTLTTKEKDAFKQAKGRMDLLIQSALENGEGEYLKAHLASIADQLGDTADAHEWNNLSDDEKGVEKVLLALQTGRTHSRLDDDTKITAANTEVRTSAGSMADVNLRHLAIAAKKQAEQTGATQWSAVTQKGVDHLGQEAWGFSGAMGDNTSPLTAGQVGTGKSETGEERRASKVQSASASLTARNAKSGAALFTRNTSGVANGFATDQAKAAVEQLQNADANTITALNREVLYALGGRDETGGSDGTAYGYNKRVRTVKFANSNIKDKSEEIYNSLKTKYNDALSDRHLGPGNPETQKRKTAFLAYARGITGDASFDPLDGLGDLMFR